MDLLGFASGDNFRPGDKTEQDRDCKQIRTVTCLVACFTCYATSAVWSAELDKISGLGLLILHSQMQTIFMDYVVHGLWRLACAVMMDFSAYIGWRGFPTSEEGLCPCVYMGIQAADREC